MNKLKKLNKKQKIIIYFLDQWSHPVEIVQCCRICKKRDRNDDDNVKKCVCVFFVAVVEITTELGHFLKGHLRNRKLGN